MAYEDGESCLSYVNERTKVNKMPRTRNVFMHDHELCCSRRQDAYNGIHTLLIVDACPNMT